MKRLAVLVVFLAQSAGLAATDPIDELVQAIWQNDTAQAKSLLKRVADVNKIGRPLGVTPLMAAASKGNTELTQFLLAKGADVNMAVNGGSTALLFAVKSGRTELVQLLLQKGADAKAIAGEMTSIMLAAETLNAAVIRELATHGANVNASTKSGYTALAAALSLSFSHGVSVDLPKDQKARALEETRQADMQARRSRVEAVQALIGVGANVNVRAGDGMTTLHLAVRASPEDLEVVRVMVDAGVDINSTNKEGTTPLMSAVADGRLDIANFLIERGASLNFRDQDGMTALMLAEANRRRFPPRGPDDIYAQRFEKISEMFRSRAMSIVPDDLKIIVRREANGHLLTAIYERNKNALQVALKEGADPSLIDQGSNDERVPVVAIVAATGDLEMTNALLDGGANLNAASADGTTVLMWAAMAGHFRIVARLLGRGVAVDARNSDGESALFEAAKWGRQTTAKLLLAEGANPNVRAKAGVTPLMWAAHEGYYELVDLLVQHGADTTAKDDEGKTALAWSKTADINGADRLRANAAVFGGDAELYKTGPVNFVIGEKSTRDRGLVAQRLVSVGSRP